MASSTPAQCSVGRLVVRSAEWSAGQSGKTLVAVSLKTTVAGGLVVGVAKDTPKKLERPKPEIGFQREAAIVLVVAVRRMSCGAKGVWREEKRRDQSRVGGFIWGYGHVFANSSRKQDRLGLLGMVKVTSSSCARCKPA